MAVEVMSKVIPAAMHHLTGPAMWTVRHEWLSKAVLGAVPGGE